MASAALLIDHDNAPFDRVPLVTVVGNWFESLAEEEGAPAIGDAIVRAYGGWWLGDDTSRSRHKAMAYYSQECPAVVKAAGRFWRLRFEFADHLLHDVGPAAPRIVNTFVFRPAPQLFLAADTPQQCAEADCEARKLRKWVLKRRGCTRAACPRAFGDLWQKPEQKQVDTHLVLDLIALSSPQSGIDHIAVISDDIDFLPALLVSAASLTKDRSLTHIRPSARPTYIDSFACARGLKILHFPSA